MITGTARWLLRLALAPRSTMAGFRAWVIEECPVAPGRRAAAEFIPEPSATAEPLAASLPAAPRAPGTRRDLAKAPRAETKTARFLSLVRAQHGPLATIPLSSVSPISAAVAPQAGLHPGSARAALRRAVLAAQNGASR